MKKIILLFSILFLNSCYSIAQKKTEVNNTHVKNLILDCYKSLRKSRISIKDEVLMKVWNNNKRLEDLITPSLFSSIQNFNIKSEKDLIKFDTFFTKEEFASMKKQIENSKVKKWSELIGRKFLNTQQKQKFEKYFSFSTPAFNKDKNLAVIYIESSNSGDLRVYKKRNSGVWEYFATGLVWRTD